jgi:hypothetical protein
MRKEFEMTVLEEPIVTEALPPAAPGAPSPERPTPRDAVRAFSVMLGGSLALAGAASASFAVTARAAAARRRPPLWALAGTAACGVYALTLRPWLRNWGADEDELRKPLPGDELVPGDVSQTTRAVTIDAPVDAVWPWLAQIGQDRGGFYSYEWLENSPAVACAMPTGSIPNGKSA